MPLSPPSPASQVDGIEIFPRAFGVGSPTKEFESPRPAIMPTDGCNPRAKDLNPGPATALNEALPSPPTSTPTHASPTRLSKRKSVNFNDKVLRSARSVPNHRLRARTIGTIPRTLPITQHLPTLQPLSFSTHNSADRPKRARLSLAAPKSTRPGSPCASRNSETNLNRLGPLESPLGAKTEARKKLAKYYFSPASFHDRPVRSCSPTPSVSSTSKQAARRSTQDILQRANDELHLFSDASSDSDDEVASSLLADGKQLWPSIDIVPKVSSCSRLQNVGDGTNREPYEEFGELRPILKKTHSQIFLAETVQQATADNGRPRLSLDPPAPSAYRRLIAAATSKNLPSTKFKSSARVLKNPPVGVLAGSSVEPSGSRPLAKSPNKTLPFQKFPDDQSSGIEPVDGSDGDIETPLPAFEDSSPNRNGLIEECLFSSIRSCLMTLQASLLPPPNEMRLDPISPLATLPSPQKHKLSKMGTLDGSPREPRDLLPRAPACHQRLDLAKMKAQPRHRKHSVARSRAQPVDSDCTRSIQPTVSGPLRTPDSSPVRCHQSLPRVAITLREVEDAYISLHDHLDALLNYWKETQPTNAEDPHSSLTSLFAGGFSDSLMKCLIREVENLCRHDDTPSQAGSSSLCNSTVPPVRDEISRMMLNTNPSGKFPASSNMSASSAPIIAKSGASTNEIRRRAAEIEAGQASMRCIALLWSWPGCMVNFQESYTQRLLSLLNQVPRSSVLRRKKNLTAIGLHNHIFKLQKLTPATLGPHIGPIVDAITSTLYLSAGKSGDKGQRVLSLGLAALRQLTTQLPQQIGPKLGKFLEPLLASLTAPDSAILRHQALRGLGALVSCTLKDWDVSQKASARVPTHVMRESHLSASSVEKARKDAFKEKLSASALAYFNDQNTFHRWFLLNERLTHSIYEGDMGWTISVMATMIALMGRRVRKLDPPLTSTFLPSLKFLLKDDRTQPLACQLWDYIIHVMLILSLDHMQKCPDEVWALEPIHLPFLMQAFRISYFYPSKGSSNPNVLSATAVSSKPTPIPTAYERLLQPPASSSISNAVVASAQPSESSSSPSSSEARGRSPRSLTNRHAQANDTLQSSSHHLSLLSACLYGIIGLVKHHLSHPPILKNSPRELLAAITVAPRFRYLDIVWDEMIEPFLPNILAGPYDAHRLYAYQLLTAICWSDSSDPSTSEGWRLERLLHPVYHDPPTQAESSSICLNQFLQSASTSKVAPTEIPPFDLLWLCIRYSKVFRMINNAIESIQYMSDLNACKWVLSTSPGSESLEELGPVAPVSLFQLWKRLLSSMGVIYKTHDWIFDTELSTSVSALSAILEKSIQIPRPSFETQAGLTGPTSISITLFRNLYRVLWQEMGSEFMNRKLITPDGDVDGEAKKISLFFKLLYFAVSSPVAQEVADSVGSRDWLEYELTLQYILDDSIVAQKLDGSPWKLLDFINKLSDLVQACKHERLLLLLGRRVMKLVIDLMKVIEPGVLLDEPLLTASGASMIDLCLLSFGDSTNLNQETRQDFIGAFIQVVSRLSLNSLKRLFTQCRLNLCRYLADEENQDREQLYEALLSRMKNVDLSLLMPSCELSDLVLAPFRNRTKTLVTSSASAAFLTFVESSAQSYIGQQTEIVEMIQVFRVVSSSRPLDAPKTCDDSLLSPLPHSPPTETQSTQSTLEAPIQLRNPSNHHPPDTPTMPSSVQSPISPNQPATALLSKDFGRGLSSTPPIANTRSQLHHPSSATISRSLLLRFPSPEVSHQPKFLLTGATQARSILLASNSPVRPAALTVSQSLEKSASSKPAPSQVCIPEHMAGATSNPLHRSAHQKLDFTVTSSSGLHLTVKGTGVQALNACTQESCRLETREESPKTPFQPGSESILEEVLHDKRTASPPITTSSLQIEQPTLHRVPTHLPLCPIVTRGLDGPFTAEAVDTPPSLGGPNFQSAPAERHEADLAALPLEKQDTILSKCRNAHTPVTIPGLTDKENTASTCPDPLNISQSSGSSVTRCSHLPGTSLEIPRTPVSSDVGILQHLDPRLPSRESHKGSFLFEHGGLRISTDKLRSDNSSGPWSGTDSSQQATHSFACRSPLPSLDVVDPALRSLQSNRPVLTRILDQKGPTRTKFMLPSTVPPVRESFHSKRMPRGGTSLPMIIIVPQTPHQAESFIDPLVVDSASVSWCNNILQFLSSHPVPGYGVKNLPPQSINASVPVSLKSATPTVTTPIALRCLSLTPTTTSASILEQRSSPNISGLGALNTLAPFAQRQSGKPHIVNSHASPVVACTTNAREALQNIKRKLALIDPAMIYPSHPKSSSSPDGSVNSTSLCKRKRDELSGCPSGPIVQNARQPVSAASTTELARRSDSHQTLCASNDGPSIVLPLSSPSLERLPNVDSFPPFSNFSVSGLPDCLPVSENNPQEPPRKKIRSNEALETPNTTKDEANVNSGPVDSSAFSNSQSPSVSGGPESDAVVETSIPKIKVRKTSTRQKKSSRISDREMQALVLDAKEPSVPLSLASSSQLGRINHITSELLVSRARMTRASLQRAIQDSEERLSN